MNTCRFQSVKFIGSWLRSRFSFYIEHQYNPLQPASNFILYYYIAIFEKLQKGEFANSGIQLNRRQLNRE